MVIEWYTNLCKQYASPKDARLIANSRQTLFKLLIQEHYNPNLAAKLDQYIGLHPEQKTALAKDTFETMVRTAKRAIPHYSKHVLVSTIASAAGLLVAAHYGSGQEPLHDAQGVTGVVVALCSARHANLQVKF